MPYRGLPDGISIAVLSYMLRFKRIKNKYKWVLFVGLTALVTTSVSVFTAQNDSQNLILLKDVALKAFPFQQDPDSVPNRKQILEDYKDLISSDFKISENMKERVGFWFDIYTKYDSNKRIIHHSLKPWIIFKVVDVSPIIEAEIPKHRWMRNQKADEYVKQERNKILEAIARISNVNESEAITPQNEYEKSALEALSAISGNLKENAKIALANIRVQTGQKNFFQGGLEDSPLYLSGIEERFKIQKVPLELTRIPFVESSFNKNAVSKVGASGLWQFMDYTGRSFMIVNQVIDERNSPFKSATAAAKLLKQNYRILNNSWPLAVTAWNHGATGLRKAIKAAGTEDLGEIILNYRSKTFDFASSNFYSEFLAALYAEKYHQEIFPVLNYEKSLEAQPVKLARTISTKELLRASGLSKNDFITYNPDLRKALEVNSYLPSGFSIMVNDAAKAVLKNLHAQDGRKSKSRVSRSEVSLNSAPIIND